MENGAQAGPMQDRGGTANSLSAVPKSIAVCNRLNCRTGRVSGAHTEGCEARGQQGFMVGPGGYEKTFGPHNPNPPPNRPTDPPPNVHPLQPTQPP